MVQQSNSFADQDNFRVGIIRSSCPFLSPYMTVYHALKSRFESLRPETLQQQQPLWVTLIDPVEGSPGLIMEGGPKKMLGSTQPLNPRPGTATQSLEPSASGFKSLSPKNRIRFAYPFFWVFSGKRIKEPTPYLKHTFFMHCVTEYTKEL